MDIDNFAQIIWDYHHMKHQLEKSDCIIVLGSHDTRVAERGAEIFLQGLAPKIIFSGYLGAFTKGVWERPEAEIFSEIAIKMGVPKDKVLIENRSTNTGENIIFSKQLLLENNINPSKIIAVQKPYMERRTFATFKKIWPEPQILVTSPQLGFDNYINEAISKEAVINIMVGDLQRIIEYPKKGFQIYQEVPNKVFEAYEGLIKMGFIKHLI